MTNEEYWNIQDIIRRGKENTEQMINGKKAPLIHDDEQIEGTFNSGAFASVEEYEEWLKK
jgi:hypothetical protein